MTREMEQTPDASFQSFLGVPLETTALDGIVGARIQKLSVTTEGQFLLTLFAGGEKSFLHVDGRVFPGQVALLDRKITLERKDPKPPGIQATLRTHLEGAVIRGAGIAAPHAVFVARLDKGDARARVLLLEPMSTGLRVMVGMDSGKGMRLLSAHPADQSAVGRRLKTGAPYVLPSENPHCHAFLERALEAETQTDVVGPSARLKTVRAALKREDKRLARLVAKLERDVHKHGEPGALRREGEVLKAWMHQVKRGDAGLDAYDFEGNPMHIVLDPAKDAAGNLALKFARAKKAERALEMALPKLEAARAAKAELDALRTGLSAPEPAAEALEAAEARLSKRKMAPSARRQAAMARGRLPYRVFPIAGDLVAWVGRGARDNDALTFHHAKGNDVWLHVRDAAGSHVVLPKAPRELSSAALIDAAHLAAWFSPLKNAPAVDVRHTRRKHLRKPGKGAPAGKVLVAEERVVHVKIEPERTARLLQGETA